MENEDNQAKMREYLQKVEETYQRFTQALVKRIDVASISTTAKIPFKAHVLKEALLYRTTELTGVAVDLYHQNKLVSTATITRSLFETAALCYYVYIHIKDVVDTGIISKIDGILMRASLGWKNDSIPMEAINVLTTIGKLNKEFNGVEFLYNGLCEFTHPNWSGCEGSFSKLNTEEHYVEFTKQYEHVPKETILPALSAALLFFEEYYNKMADLLPKLNTICEAEIDKRMTKLKYLAHQTSQKQTIGLYFDPEKSKHWAICTEHTDNIISACPIDEEHEKPILVDKYNEYLTENFDKFKFVTDV